MTALGQKVLVSLLTEKDAVDLLAREGLDPACIPTEDLRKVVEFSLDYYHRSGREKAPTPAVLATEFGDLLNDHEIDFDNVEESIEWAVDDLRATYIHKEVAAHNKSLAVAMAECETHDRIAVAQQYAREFVALVSRLESHETVVDARFGIAERLLAYEERVATRDTFRGMTFGLPGIDEYTRGIHPGELACTAAGPKTGKSFFAVMVAYEEWVRGRSTALYSLENSVEMTLDRLGCWATGVDSNAWQEGNCTPEEVERVREFIERMQASPNPIWVHQPPIGARSVEAMVLDAQMRGVDNLIIDQLTFIDAPDPTQPRHIQIRDITHTLKSMISTDRHRLPCLLLHQINREGVKAADKVGHLEMYHLAEGAEVERTCDWIFGMYRSVTERAMNQMKFQTLGARRKDVKHFQMNWAVNTGAASVAHELTLD